MPETDLTATAAVATPERLQSLRQHLGGVSRVSAAAQLVVDELVVRGYPMPSVYLASAGRLRCIAVRGYWQILDGISPEEGVLGRAYRTGKVQVVRDVEDWSEFIPAIPGIVGEICVPLRHAGRVVGGLNVESPRAVGDGDVAVVLACARALERRLAELGGPDPETPWQRLARQLAELNDLTDLDAAVEHALRTACELVGMDSALLAIREGDRPFTVRGTRGPLGGAIGGLEDTDLAAIASWVDPAASSYTHGELGDTGLIGHEPLRAVGVGASAVVALGLRGGDRGFIMTAAPHPRTPTADAIQRLELLAAQVSSTFQTLRTLDRLRDQAARDSLTGLGHNATFHARLAEERRADPRPLAVFLVDLDGFKQINDRLGHQRGDIVLTDVAHALGHAVRDADRAFRIGGDEFAALARVGSHEEAVTLATRLRDAVRRCGVSASIGVAVGSGGVHDTGDAGQGLLTEADLALYEAKRKGRDRVELFAPPLRAGVIRRAKLAADFAHAIARDELFLVYQPIIDLASGSVLGLEALARWRHPQRGIIGPTDFVPLAEEDGQIGELGAWVLAEACREARTWGAGPGRLKVAVNVSPAQLNAQLVADVQRALRTVGLDPDRLILEMTESVMVDEHAGLGPLRTLRADGVGIAVDDFGTGYSSLSYLRRLPIDILKIDRSFVAEIADPRNVAVARAIVQLSRNLGLATVAEGVEQPWQAEQLQALGCDYSQGDHYAHPVPAKDVAALIARFGVTPAA